MSQVSPGWYPDPSGRFAQRYHDGTRWTEHVADASGQRSVDQPEGQGAAPAANPYEQQQSGQGWGAQQQPQQPQQPQQQPSGEGWPAGGQAQQPYGQQQAYGQQQGYGQPSSGQWGAQPGYGQPYGQPGYGYAPSGGGFTPTVGLIVAGVGGLLVLLSLFVLDFINSEPRTEFGGRSESGTLSDLGDIPEINSLADLYTSLGRILGLLVVAVAILAILRLPALKALNDVPNLPIIVAAACGVFAIWHLITMFVSPPDVLADAYDLSPAIGAWLGLIGWIGLGAGQFLKQPVGGNR